MVEYTIRSGIGLKQQKKEKNPTNEAKQIKQRN